MTAELAERFARGDKRALAQAITVVERGGPGAAELLALLRDVPLGDPAAVADLVLAAAERAGPAADDVALMVVRPALVAAFAPGPPG
jgi:hypothetical protein